MGPHGAPWAPSSPVVGRRIFVFFYNKCISPFWGVQNGSRLRGWDPPSEIRAEILCLLVVGRVQMVARRPIWWQKGVIWGPLVVRAALAHPWAWGVGGWGGPRPLIVVGACLALGACLFFSACLTSGACLVLGACLVAGACLASGACLTVA